MGVVHGLEHGQGATPMGLAITCGESGITVQSVPGPTLGQALPKELSVCTTHRKELRQAGTWDLEPFAVKLAPGKLAHLLKLQNTKKLQETKNTCACAAGAVSGQKIQKDPKLQLHFSHSVVSNSLGLHELQHPWPPCPSPSPGVH